MTITPVDIRRKEFNRSVRGYDANQVDDYLDAIADEFERTYSESSRLREEVGNLRERLEQFEKLETSIREALVQAQQAAADLRRSASAEAEFTIREAKARAHQMLADSSSRVERVQESYEALRKAKENFASDFRYLLKSYMTVMDNVEVASAKELEQSLRERLDVESLAAAREAAQTQRLSVQNEDQEPENARQGEPQTPQHEQQAVVQREEPQEPSVSRAEEPVPPPPQETQAQQSQKQAPPQSEGRSVSRREEESPSQRREVKKAGPLHEDRPDESFSMPRGSKDDSVTEVISTGSPRNLTQGEGVREEGASVPEGARGETRHPEEQAKAEGDQEDKRFFRASRFLRRRG